MEYSTETRDVPATDVDVGLPEVESPAGSPLPLPRSPAPVLLVADDVGGKEVELASLYTMDEEQLDADHDTDVPLWFRRMDNILGRCRYTV
jgi:hypothetical protein